MIGVCLECDEQLDIPEESEVGDTVRCPHCKTLFEILDLDPVVLDYAKES